MVLVPLVAWRPGRADLVGRRFTAGRPDQPWCGDVTTFATGEGWLYLAPVPDLCLRRRRRHRRNRGELVMAAVEEPLDRLRAEHSGKLLPQTAGHRPQRVLLVGIMLGRRRSRSLRPPGVGALHGADQPVDARLDLLVGALERRRRIRPDRIPHRPVRPAGGRSGSSYALSHTATTRSAGRRTSTTPAVRAASTSAPCRRPPTSHDGAPGAPDAYPRRRPAPSYAGPQRRSQLKP